MATVFWYQFNLLSFDYLLMSWGKAGKGLTIQSSALAQKADFALGVASNQADDDGFLFPTLKSIYAAQFDARILLFERCQSCDLRTRSIVLHTDVPRKGVKVRT